MKISLMIGQKFRQPQAARTNWLGASAKAAALGAWLLAGLAAPAPSQTAEPVEGPMPPLTAKECINDDQILRSLTDTLAQRLEAGQTTPMKTLQGQLNRSFHRLDLPTPAAKRLTPMNLYQKCKDSVLVVGTLYKCPRCHQWHVNSSAGFLLTASGVFVTAYHVVNGVDLAAMGASTAQGSTYVVKEVLAASKADDVAVLQLQGTDFKPLGLAVGDPVGTTVSVISHPDNGFYALTQGIISRYYLQNNQGKRVPRLSVTADFAKGSSGAPVLNEFGRAVGMVSATHSIYYNTEAGQEKNLQMVVKMCVPSVSILKLIQAAPKR